MRQSMILVYLRKGIKVVQIEQVVMVGPEDQDGHGASVAIRYTQAANKLVRRGLVHHQSDESQTWFLTELGKQRAQRFARRYGKVPSDVAPSRVIAVLTSPAPPRVITSVEQCPGVKVPIPGCLVLKILNSRDTPVFGDKWVFATAQFEPLVEIPAEGPAVRIEPGNAGRQTVYSVWLVDKHGLAPHDLMKLARLGFRLQSGEIAWSDTELERSFVDAALTEIQLTKPPRFSGRGPAAHPLNIPRP